MQRKKRDGKTRKGLWISESQCPSDYTVSLPQSLSLSLETHNVHCQNVSQSSTVALFNPKFHKLIGHNSKKCETYSISTVRPISILR